jgi:hypothetical protein
MRKAAKALGIVSALFSALSIWWAQFLGWLGPFAGDFLVFVVGIGGGVLALTRPVAAGILMLVTGIGGFIAVHVFHLPLFSWPTIVAFFPLISGGVLALTAREKQPAARVAAMILGIFGGLCSSYATYVVIATAMPGGFVIWGFLCSLMAIAGGAISLDRPTQAGKLMLLSAIGSGGITFTIVSTMGVFCPMVFKAYSIVFCLIATLALIPGGVFALVSPTVKGPAWIIAATIVFVGIIGGLLATLGPYAVLYSPFVGAPFLIVGGALALAWRKERRAKNSQRP